MSILNKKKNETKNVGNLIITHDEEGVYMFLEIVGSTPEEIMKMKEVTLTVKSQS